MRTYYTYGILALIMDIKTSVPLSTLTTMRLGGPARFFAEAHSVEQIIALCKNARTLNQKFVVIGGGSNLIVHDEGFDGLVIRNAIPGFEVIEEDDSAVTLQIGGGELWDAVVSRSVGRGLTGIEALSGIPGTAGAAPVQNIGAYGQEIADTLVSLDAYDTINDQLVRLSWEDCGFAYRHSIFRDDPSRRYIIVAISLKLYKRAPQPPFYAAVQKHLDAAGVTEFTPAIIRSTVLEIRANKLPDPELLPNAGSFFKNAIVEKWRRDELLEQYNYMTSYEMDENTYKIPTGWLIQESGLSGEVLHGIKVHEGNNLVLINESATSYADLAAAREEIQNAVRDTFRIDIEQEPIELA